MQDHVLILGGSGRFGRHAAQAFHAAGWKVHRFDRRRDNLARAADGMDVIVHGWNPPYQLWQRQVPAQTAQVIDAARRSGATLLIPGNIYVYGKRAPEVLGTGTAHAATNPLGRVRIAMEDALRAAKVPTIVLRAGDFIDTEASGNWFDRVIVAELDRGRFRYPGRMDAPHAWAYLPDLGRAAVALAEQRGRLERFQEVLFPGYTLTGEELAQALEQVVGGPLRRKGYSYLPLQLSAPFWKMGRHLVEMRFLWNMPHRLDSAGFAALLPDFRPTPLTQALARAISPCQDRAGHRTGG